MMTKKEAKKLTDTKTKCDFIRGVNDVLEGIYDKFYPTTVLMKDANMTTE